MHTPQQPPLQAEKQPDAVQRTTAGIALQERDFVDSRPAAAAQRKLAEMMNNSPRVLQQQALSDAIHNSPRMVAQRNKINALFGGAAQLEENGEMPPQLSPVQREEKPNNTGLPNQLKSGIESLSGISMDHVKVHYNSEKPAQLLAHAYAQGSEIHVGPGQERHLSHEAWHVVQQAQGRVRATMQMKPGTPLNDDVGLEGEADLMGEQASRLGHLVEKGPVEMLGMIPNSSPVTQLTAAELTNAQTIWNQHHAKHGIVDGHVQADILALQGAYNHYLLPANGSHNDVVADGLNPFLRSSVLGLMHDMEEIDSHAGGYYYQQEVKAGRNAARNILNEQGARGGVSNLRDPDLIVTQGPGGVKGAIEVKRTTTQNGLDGMLTSAISQLSRRTGYSSATVEVEVTHPTQVATIVGNRAAVDQTVIDAVSNNGFAKNYYPQAIPYPGGLWGPTILLTVAVRDGVAGGLTYDRDFRVHLRQAVGRGGRMSYSVEIVLPAATRV
ncbi:eCIS core domain-containing protein [Undibacterium terreum]|uniref:eCIS core domain-containing protein n=1 Tax=Undibacterium terreum TaxID=1224302 RepID=A0A916ULD4_9BURK|nr:DUF4157 domain-containing protein [Undibacterium terreum]GGC77423.1 hypothetical protein GCM10011396_25720 [Undibacterium terreum]